MSSYKVVWKEIAGKISGKGQFMASVVPPLQDADGKIRPIIPDHKLMFIPLQNEDEAFYVSGILNSSLMRLIVGSTSNSTKRNKRCQRIT